MTDDDRIASPEGAKPDSAPLTWSNVRKVSELPTSKIAMDKASTLVDEVWLFVWMAASVIAGFVWGGKAFGESEDIYGGSTFNGAAAFGIAIAVAISNIPVMVIGRTLLAIFREQVALVSYTRAVAEGPPKPPSK